MALVHRFAAVLLCLGLIAGNTALCEGWQPTPEARMACCADGEECPMHHGESHEAGAPRALTQAQADGCCATSEREPSTPSPPALVAAISVAVLGSPTVLPATVPALVLSDGWRTATPVPIRSVPKYVLLSVFLL